MGMIIVEPMGGLANRLRFIASAAWLKEQTRKELIKKNGSLDKIGTTGK
eukprot:gene47629-61943_t